MENSNHTEIKKYQVRILLKLRCFILKNNYFESDRGVFQQISGITIRTKFTPPCACIFMDQHKTEFSETQILKHSLWYRYMYDIFFTWTHGEEKLKKFMEDFNSFSHDINLLTSFIP